MDTAGNLYGMTSASGDQSCADRYSNGCGTVFEVTPGGALTVLHTFTGSPQDGGTPAGGLLRDQLGDLYGTTEYGGAHGWGTVFRLSANGQCGDRRD